MRAGTILILLILLSACGGSSDDGSASSTEGDSYIIDSDDHLYLQADDWDIPAKTQLFKTSSYAHLKVQDSSNLIGTWVYTHSFDIEYRDDDFHPENESRFYQEDFRGLISIFENASGELSIAWYNRSNSYYGVEVNPLSLFENNVSFDSSWRYFFSGEVIDNSEIVGELYPNNEFVNIKNSRAGMIKISATPTAPGLGVGGDIDWGGFHATGEMGVDTKRSVTITHPIHFFEEERFKWGWIENGTRVAEDHIYTIMVIGAYLSDDNTSYFSTKRAYITNILQNQTEEDDHEGWRTNLCLEIEENGVSRDSCISGGYKPTIAPIEAIVDLSTVNQIQGSIESTSDSESTMKTMEFSIQLDKNN